MQENTTCDWCKKRFYKRPSLKKYTKKHFCSVLCSHKYKRRNQVICKCATCEKELALALSQSQKSKSGRHFCSKSCAITYNNSAYRSGKNHPNWTNGQSSYRDRGLKHYGSKCQNAHCTLHNVQEEMLDVHHIDGNRENNKIDNLIVLCVWCHALLTRGLATLDDSNNALLPKEMVRNF